jgi:hypothetical protein
MRLPSSYSTLGYRRLFHRLALSATVFSSRSVFAFSSMSTHATERSNGTITVSPRNEASQSGLVVICHGLGDSAEGFADVAEVSLFRLIDCDMAKEEAISFL